MAISGNASGGVEETVGCSREPIGDWQPHLGIARVQSEALRRNQKQSDPHLGIARMQPLPPPRLARLPERFEVASPLPLRPSPPTLGHTQGGTQVGRRASRRVGRIGRPDRGLGAELHLQSSAIRGGHQRSSAHQRVLSGCSEGARRVLGACSEGARSVLRRNQKLSEALRSNLAHQPGGHPQLNQKLSEALRSNLAHQPGGHP